MSGEPVPIGFEMTETAVAPAPEPLAPGYPPAPAPIGFEELEVVKTDNSDLPEKNNSAGADAEQPITLDGSEDHTQLLPAEKQLESEVFLQNPSDPNSAVTATVMPDLSENLFFDDGKRRIDYVLAYSVHDDPQKSQDEKTRRDFFQKELEDEGLELEQDVRKKINYVKIHAPWEVLTKGAEMMNMKMPLSPNDMGLEVSNFLDCIPTPFDLDKELFDEEENYFTAPFSRARLNQFQVGPGKKYTKDNFFTNAQRSRIVHDILARSPYEKAVDGRIKFGIKRLINNGTYSAAYPLHDGSYHSEHSIKSRGKMNDRHFLYELWARPRAWAKFQPLDQIRDYFGEKIGIYFAWLGYYTMMLIPASIVGLVAFIYGCITIFDDVPGNEICDPEGAGNLTMCPLCDQRCSYWQLRDSCNYSRATYLFDNPATVAFACFMALWASFFHEVWKRKQAEIEYDWDVADFEQEEETIRPEFESKIMAKKPKVRPNPITKKDEPYIPNWSKCMRYCTTVSVVLLFLCMVLAAVFGVILYRIVIAAVFYASDQYLIRARASLVASGTAACINLVIIVLLNFVYQRIASALTELESPRTETEWEDSFTFKMFLFQGVNFYSSIVYIAFLKGRFVGRPGDYDYNLFGFRQEECDPAGCLIELCIQMGIIMVGKQAFANFKEILLPKLTVWFKSRQVEKAAGKQEVLKRWEHDYALAEIPRLGLFDEYLEMVIQYGFVTIFVAAFPLAPLFALLNNIIEIRLDAYKFVTQWRRPLATRAQDIGIWFGILQGISAFAVVTNAVIIAFTSEFIPRMVYKYMYSPDQTLHGYYDFTMSRFNTTQFQEQSIPDDPKIEEFGNVTECRYRDFREPPGGANEYEYTIVFWHVLAARLAFIVVFENLIVFLTWLVMYLVPDIPYNVKIQMLRERYLSKQALLNAEMKTTL